MACHHLHTNQYSMLVYLVLLFLPTATNTFSVTIEKKKKLIGEVKLANNQLLSNIAEYW